MFGLGMPELVAILVIAVIFFGCGKLPEVMGSLGKGVREFTRSVQEHPSDKEIDKQQQKETEHTPKEAEK